jgi:2-oxoglutarate ferredoxin oxidoreductase subunit beta
MTQPTFVDEHPRDSLIRVDRLPHIWCPACGLGEVLNCFAKAVEGTSIPLDRHVVVSGIGCTGRTAGYINLDSYHTTHGRPIAFATGMKLGKPELEVTVISGDGDLVTIGGNHLIHAARRNLDLNVIMVNNFNYGMTGGQFGGTTPVGAKTTTTPYGNYEQAFNMPYLMKASGASYIARWTTLHIRQLEKSIRRAFEVDGFAFIEVISPCYRGYGRKNRFRESIDQMKYFEEMSYLEADVDLAVAELRMSPEDPLIIGDFEDKKLPSYREVKRKILEVALGDSQ